MLNLSAARTAFKYILPVAGILAAIFLFVGFALWGALSTPMPWRVPVVAVEVLVLIWLTIYVDEAYR